MWSKENYELWIDGKLIPPEFYLEVVFQRIPENLWESWSSCVTLLLRPKQEVVVTFRNGNTACYENSRVKFYKKGEK